MISTLLKGDQIPALCPQVLSPFTYPRLCRKPKWWWTRMEPKQQRPPVSICPERFHTTAFGGSDLVLCSAAILLARSSPPWVSVDRPFLFLIRHKPTGTFYYYLNPAQVHLCVSVSLTSCPVSVPGAVLFMGQINQP